MTLNLAALSAELEAGVEAASSMVVAVHCGRMAASGVLWRQGVIVTSEHPLKQDDDLAVTLPDGAEVRAALVGRDAGTDLAVLRYDGTLAPARSRPQPPRPGQVVLALGRSPNSGVNAAMGIVSAVSGPWRTWRGGQMDAYIRLDVRLFPASSGGPVLTVAGEVIGVATGVLSRVAPLAVPAATVDRVVDDILAKGRVSRGFLGVGLQPVTIPDALRAPAADAAAGVIVLSVEPGGPADRAGIVIGDVLLALNGRPVGEIEEVQAALDAQSIGKPVPVRLLRGGRPREIAVTVGERRA